jgi:preprotein translocase subunit SecF
MATSKEKKVYNFMGLRYAALAISGLLIVLSIWSLAVNRLNFGLDFTGGTLIEVGYEQPADLNAIRDVMVGAGYEDAVVVQFGSEQDVLIRMQRGFTDTLGDEVLTLLRNNIAANDSIELRRVEFVGPQVGDELRDQGGMAMLAALGIIMIYIALRFQFKFSVGAVAALAHDVIITLGFFSFFQVNFDLTVLAALLAVIGYSLNDTIVVADRIRENFRIMRKSSPTEVINTALTDTLSRTLVTSLTTVMVLLALFFFGGEIIHSFAEALLLGVAIGTYSSIYIAASILLSMNITHEDLIVEVVKEGEFVDDLP